jgi:hypothetical protein
LEEDIRDLGRSRGLIRSQKRPFDHPEQEKEKIEKDHPEITPPNPTPQSFDLLKGGSRGPKNSDPKNEEVQKDLFGNMLECAPGNRAPENRKIGYQKISGRRKKKQTP